MTKVILSIFLVLVPHVLSSDLAHGQEPLLKTGESNSVTSRTSPPTGSSRPEATPAIPDEGPIIVTANLTTTSNGKTLEGPISVLAKINTVKSEEGEAPRISLVPPSFPGGPVGLVAHVPPRKPVEINADVPPETLIKFQAEVSPDVPLLAVVVGHGMARFYSPWKKASSTTRNMFNVNLR